MFPRLLPSCWHRRTDWFDDRNEALLGELLQAYPQVGVGVAARGGSPAASTVFSLEAFALLEWDGPHLGSTC